jgi:DNA-binding response OmpR family regulator
LKRILIAEDDRDIRALLKLAFRPKPYDIVPAEDGLQAVNLAASESFDLIIMDVHMPALTGFEASHEIRRTPLNEATPILFLTASLAQLPELSGISTLKKPFSITQLLGRVEALVGA